MIAGRPSSTTNDLTGKSKLRWNVHVTLTEFRNESRVLKEARSVLEHGLVDRVLIIAMGASDLPSHEFLDNNLEVYRIALATRKLPRGLYFQGIKYAEFVLRILVKTWRLNAVFHIHSIDILPCAAILKLSRIAKNLVYDAHELETESASNRSPVRKWLARLVERNCLRFVDQTVVVNDTIADWYASTYPLPRPIVIRNTPKRPDNVLFDSPILRNRLKIPQDDLIFIYQGDISEGRGIDALLSSFSHRSLEGKHLVIMGYGSLVEQVRAFASQHRCIHYLPPVRPDEVIDYTCGADVGLSLILPICLSYEYCLPNKLFEYSIAGIPSIVSDLPVMGEFIDRYSAGWRVKPDSQSLLDFLQGLSRETVLAKKQAVRASCQQLGWHTEENNLFAIYRDFCLDTSQ